MEPIDGVLMALTLGATFVARSFSGDKNQLVPILKAGLAHRGFALVDVVSPCVTFNDHDGSTKSYLYTREHQAAAIEMSFVPHRDEIVTEYAAGTTREVAESKRTLLELLIRLKREGKQVVGYGAPGKGNTLLNYCGIGTYFLDYTVDRNPYKHGRFTPGMQIPIEPPERIAV